MPNQMHLYKQLNWCKASGGLKGDARTRFMCRHRGDSNVALYRRHFDFSLLWLSRKTNTTRPVIKHKILRFPETAGKRRGGAFTFTRPSKALEDIVE